MDTTEVSYSRQKASKFRDEICNFNASKCLFNYPERESYLQSEIMFAEEILVLTESLRADQHKWLSRYGSHER